MALTTALAGGEEKKLPPPPDVSEELARARKAASDANHFGIDARQKAADGNAKDSIDLLEKQDNANDAAEAAFRAAVAKDARNPRALSEFGRFWFTRRHYIQARMYAERALAAFEKKPAQEKPPASGAPEKPEYDELSSFTPAEIAEFQCDQLRLLGSLLERAGENEYAINCYYKGLNLAPTDAKMRICLAIALCANGRPLETTTILKNWSAESAAPAEDVPSDPALRALGVYTLAVAQEETGYYEQALQTYTIARKLAVKAGEAESAGVFDNANLAIERLQDFFDDIKDRDALHAKENQTRVQNKLEPIAGEREQISKALYRFDQGMSFKERALKDPTFVTALARARSEWGGPDERDALINHPEWDTFHASMKWFEEALKAYPRLHQAAYELALCNIVTGHYAPARQFLDESASASPYNRATLNEQANVLMELGQWDEAVGVFRKILALDPDSGFANFGLARAYLALQRDDSELQSALDAVERAEQLAYRDPRMLHRQTIVKKDGTEVLGIARMSGDKYTVMIAPGNVQDIPKAECQEVIEHLSLKEEIEAMIARFAQGERPAKPKRIKGQKKPERAGRNPWDGTILPKY